MSKIRMVVFDMAGTTVNEENVVYKTLRSAINADGYAVTLQQVLDEGAGKEKMQAIKDILRTYADTVDENMTANIYQLFLARLSNAYNELEVSGEPHVLEVFSELKTMEINRVLNTGYNRATAQLLLSKLGWRKGMEYDELITADDVINARPAPDMILLAMQRLNVTDAGAVVKVGDSTVDILEGKNAGCGLSIGITTGAHTRDQLQQAYPDYIIDDLLSLLNLI